MKHSDILPECFIDSTLIGTLLSAKVSHKHSSNEVAKDFDLPSNLEELQESTKDSIATLKDPRILKLCKAMCHTPEGAKLKEVLEYLSANKYKVDVEALKQLIIS